jgi:putative oligomerization/nucleic acid binding protein
VNANIDALEQLAVMRERGLVTEAEYQAKREEILARLAAPLVTRPIQPAPRPAPVAPTTQPDKKATRGQQLVGAMVVLGLLWIVGRVAGVGDTGTPRPLETYKPPPPAWQPPAGFGVYSGNRSIAFQWLDDPTDCLGDACWAMEVVTEGGCPTTLYVEVGIEDDAGTQIGYSNDVASGLAPGQRARLTFDSFESKADTARITEMTCY